MRKYDIRRFRQLRLLKYDSVVPNLIHPDRYNYYKATLSPGYKKYNKKLDGINLTLARFCGILIRRLAVKFLKGRCKVERYSARELWNCLLDQTTALSGVACTLNLPFFLGAGKNALDGDDETIISFLRSWADSLEGKVQDVADKCG